MSTGAFVLEEAFVQERMNLSIVKTTNGTYDFASSSMEATLRLDYDVPPEMKDAYGSDGLEDFRILMIQTDDDMFVSAPSWTGRSKDRWIHYEPGDLKLAFEQFGISPELGAFAPTPLYSLLAAAGGPVEQSGDTYTVHVSGNALLRALGGSMVKGLVKLGSDLDVEGRYPLEVTLNGGFISQIHVDGSSIFVEAVRSAAEDPSGFEGLDTVTLDLTLTLSRHGQPVEIEAPPENLWDEATF